MANFDTYLNTTLASIRLKLLLWNKVKKVRTYYNHIDHYRNSTSRRSCFTFYFKSTF